MPAPIQPRPARRGSVIAIVLAVITLAAFLLAAFVERSTTELLVETRAAQAARLRVQAHSALEAALAVLAAYRAEDGGLHAPAQGWGDPLAGVPLPLAAAVRVRVTDESGKPSLPRLEAGALAELLEELGLRAADAARVAEALLVWTRGGGGSARLETEARQYGFADPPHQAPARPLGSFGELAAVAVAREHFFDLQGRPTPLLRSLAEAVSLHEYPATNLNTASARTLALAGLDRSTAERLHQQLAPPPGARPAAPRYFRSIGEASALLGGLPPGFGTTAHVLRVSVDAREGATNLRLEAVVRAGGRAAGPAGAAAPAEPEENAARPFTLLDLDETLEMNAPLP